MSIATYQAFNADPAVQIQRLNAYEYATLQPSKPRRAICLVGGGELHQADGTILPVPPGDWIAETPDGHLISISAEEVADFWTFVDGTEDDEAAYERTVESVKNGRKAPSPNVPFAEAPTEPGVHPDGQVAVDTEQHRRDLEGGAPPKTAQERASVLSAFEQQVARAHEQLTGVANTAVERGLINSEQAAAWINSGVTPEGILVSRNDLGGFDISRVADLQNPVDAGDEDEQVEGAGVDPEREQLEGKSFTALWADAKELDVEPEGTGVGGAVKKGDLVNAILDAQKAAA